MGVEWAPPPKDQCPVCYPNTGEGACCSKHRHGAANALVENSVRQQGGGGGVRVERGCAVVAFALLSIPAGVLALIVTLVTRA
jgi:hypothetical protein